ncbi:MAG: hypothetical protein O9346_03240 [Leptospiraceae bacterium]|nr:hypothetical protein [Leptospiraceae bacterium]MCZ8239348.1 hypothetical protein [Leptospiraceae bacterium]MCZ8345410.1 hypothetical protein [Leptospiraceae bacterium]NCN09177.1 hypothetical protein [Leptospira sp.]PJE02409.1 MAG: hypothetical protein CK427_08005 [Leptospira sp.]
MKKLSIQGNLAESTGFGPDPVMLRKSGQSSKIIKKSESYKKRILDPNYMDFAIDKIAVELLHFISK